MHFRRNVPNDGAKGGGGGIGKVRFPVVPLPPLGSRGCLLQPPTLSASSPSTAAAASAATAASEELDLSRPPFYDEINPDVDDDHARRRDVKVEDRSHHLERDVVREFSLALFVCKGGEEWEERSWYMLLIPTCLTFYYSAKDR